MTIYIYSNWFLPAYKAGGPVQTIANLVGVEEPGVSYKIICSDRELDGSRLVVKTGQWVSFNRWTEVYYVAAGAEVPLPAGPGDTLFLNSLYSWRFTLRPLLFSGAVRIILSARGMLHRGALSQKSLKKKVYLAAWKGARLHLKLAFHAVDGVEERAIRAVFGQKVKVHLAANLPRTFNRQGASEKKRDSLHLVSVALVSPMKNILQVLQALKAVPERINYHIYGPIKDNGYWQQCLQVAAGLPAHITLHYHGDIHPAGVEEALRSGQVFILPSKSENFGHAIYEALTAGKPVITSHNTPWNDLERSGAGINVAPENSPELAAAIRFFAAMDAPELEAWSRGASIYAQNAINFDEIRDQYRRMFSIGQPAASPADKKE